MSSEQIDVMSTTKNILFLALGLGVSYIAYSIFQFYLKKKKYHHIPGPPTNGYFVALNRLNKLYK